MRTKFRFIKISAYNVEANSLEEAIRIFDLPVSHEDSLVEDVATTIRIFDEGANLLCTIEDE